MSSVSWWISIALAAVYLPAGLMKLVVPKSRLETNAQFGWMATMSASVVKGIGAAEILGALGVIAPRLIGIAPALGIAAAWGLAAVQIGAIVVHARRREFVTVPMNVVLLVLAVLVAARLV